VVEGCGAGAAVCRPFLSALVWVQAPEAVRFERAIARDGESYRPHWRQWADQEGQHYAREGTAARADVVLDTSPL
jgi:cytidylate kinase